MSSDLSQSDPSQSDRPQSAFTEQSADPAPLSQRLEPASEQDPAPESAAREGLPRGFRMRHDAHYVDQLDALAPPAVLRMLPLGRIDAPSCDDGPAIEALARSIRQVGIVEPLVVRRNAGRYEVIAGAKRLSAARLAHLDRVPCVVHEDLPEDAIGAVTRTVLSRAKAIDDRPRGPFSSTSRERVLDDAIASLAAARTSVELTLPRADGLRSRAAGDLVRAELLNARLSLTAMRLLSAAPIVRRTRESARQLLESVLGEMAPIVRLSNAAVTLDVPADCPDFSIMRPLVTFALEACLSTAVNLAGDTPKPALTCSVAANAQTGEVSYTVRLEGSWVPAETAQRLTDMEWPGHPAGPTGAMMVAAAECVARLHGGTLNVVTEYEGFGITLALRDGA